MLHEEKQYPTVAPHIPPNSQMEMLSSLISDETDAVIEFSLVGRPFNASFLTIVADWDMDQVNILCFLILFVLVVSSGCWLAAGSHLTSHKYFLANRFKFTNFFSTAFFIFT